MHRGICACSTDLNPSHIYRKAIMKFPGCLGKITFFHLEDVNSTFPLAETTIPKTAALDRSCSAVGIREINNPPDCVRCA